MNIIEKAVKIPFTEEESEAVTQYVKENGLKFRELCRRLLIMEIKNKTTILSEDYIPPKIKESLFKRNV